MWNVTSVNATNHAKTFTCSMSSHFEALSFIFQVSFSFQLPSLAMMINYLQVTMRKLRLLDLISVQLFHLCRPKLTMHLLTEKDHWFLALSALVNATNYNLVSMWNVMLQSHTCGMLRINNLSVLKFLRNFLLLWLLSNNL